MTPPIAFVPAQKKLIPSLNSAGAGATIRHPLPPPPGLERQPSQHQPQLQQVGIGEPHMDRYASSYIPLWLRQVNEDQHYTLIPLPADPNYDYDAFVSEFLPRKLVFSSPDEEDVGEEKSNGVENVETKVDAGKGELVKIDSTWLTGDDDLDLELESDHKTQSSHASVGAFSQGQVDIKDAPSAVVTSPRKATQRKITETRLASPLPPLRPATYAERLTKLLQVEHTHQKDTLAAQTLFDVQLGIYPERKEGEKHAWSQDHLYSLRLPGVREDYPNLVPGDLLQLRVLASNMASWLKMAFEAKVYVVHKVDGIVIIKCDALSSRLQGLFAGVEAAHFNILFISSAFRGSAELIGGLERIGRFLTRPKSKTGAVLRNWLFPSVDKTEINTSLPPIPMMEWNDTNLNTEQRGIVKNVVYTPHRSVPFLIHGPPGTGKTKTLVETTLQILKHDTSARIILSAPSVTAADTLAMRLAPFLNPQQMTRINDPRRTFGEVPESLLIYCTIVESDQSARFGLPEWSRLIKTQVVIVATQDVHILHHCKMSNLELGRWQAVTMSPLLGNTFIPRLHWSHLIIDEAGQSSEAEMANSLLLVVPSSHHDIEASMPVVILCGDIAQLGPQIDSHFARSHGLDISLLERLSKRKIYHRQLSKLRLHARQLLLKGDYRDTTSAEATDTLDSSPSLSACAAHLVRNYRARNNALLHVVSMLFYDDCLLPCAPISSLDLSQWSFPNPQVPILVEHIDSKDEWVDEGASFYNTEEIDRVVELCQSLTGWESRKKSVNGFVAAKDIAVITPYREQVWRIRLKLRKKGLSAVSVGNVEVYQGAEHRVTIISTVRTSPRFLEIDAKRNLGLIYERKRLCVSISRAQEALIIVGNADLLRLDPYWRSFISYAKRNKCLQCEGKSDEEEGSYDDGEQVGALEYTARMHRASNGSNSTSITDRDTAYLAGRMAASTLFEEEDDGLETDEE